MIQDAFTFTELFLDIYLFILSHSIFILQYNIEVLKGKILFLLRFKSWFYVGPILHTGNINLILFFFK